ncbi:NAD-dependent deacylase [Marinospirillum perlucidum]|uniref:NAD-dependent deacylase n=1 Tax=Marinospirillum perlucidum TaxID=1982602 RepID=UPI000DF1795C|nr:NAD-dependent deacylase [Marinospirillum perlucidum]
MSLAYSRIVVLTGAGISAESGISTFRDSNGLWENHSIEEVASPEGFQRNPEKVLEFYNLRRAQLLDPQIQPNPAHQALGRFAQEVRQQGGQFTLISQNVDDLHQRAGNRDVISMHGQLLSALCSQSGRARPWSGPLNLKDVCDCCDPPQQLRPDIVWFGEVPYHLEACYQALSEADLFVALGTSGQVYPAAGFTELASQAGATTVEINLEPTSRSFDAGYYGPASIKVPEFLEKILAGKA